jgi:hypothetical protein
VAEVAAGLVDLRTRAIGHPNDWDTRMLEFIAEFCEPRLDTSAGRNERVDCAVDDERYTSQAVASGGSLIVAIENPSIAEEKRRRAEPLPASVRPATLPPDLSFSNLVTGSGCGGCLRIRLGNADVAADSVLADFVDDHLLRKTSP